jgi:hypothetical protein
MILWGAIGSAHADNPPEGNTNVSGLAFAEVTTESIGQRVGFPSGNVDAFRVACDQGKPMWLLGREKPFACRGQSSSTDWMLDLPVDGLSAYTDKYTTRLVSTRPMRTLPLAESDGALDQSLKAVLPEAYREARHAARVAWRDATLVFVPGVAYPLADPSCIAMKTAVLSIQEGRTRLVGELDTMPRTLVQVDGIDGPFIWGDVGCISQPASTLWRISPALAAVASYVNGIEDETTPEELDAAARDAIERRRKLGVINCSMAVIATEAVICAHPELLELDGHIAQSFANLRAAYKDDNLNDFVDGQKLWLVERNDCHNSPTWQPYAEGEFGCLWTVMNRRSSRLGQLEAHQATLASTAADYSYVNPAYLHKHAKAYVGKLVRVFGTLGMEDCGHSPRGKIYWRSADIAVRSTEPERDSCAHATAYWPGTVAEDNGTFYLQR